MLTGINVYFNDVLIPVKNLKVYSQLYPTAGTPNLLYINKKNTQIVVTPSLSAQFQDISFVNGVYTRLGGTHVDAWIKACFQPIVKKLSKKGAKFSLTDVKRFFRIFVSVQTANPEFDSQSKHKLESAFKARVETKETNKLLKLSLIHI